MLMALVAGTTDPALLADLARGQLRKKLPELRQALTGRFGPHHRFMVSRLLADIDYVEEASAELSRRIEELLAPFAAAVERLITIPGVQRRTAEVMVAEIGADMAASPAPRISRAGPACVPAIMRARVNAAAAKPAEAIAGYAPRWLKPVVLQAAPSTPPLAHVIVACADT